jgi:hypothetical protein
VSGQPGEYAARVRAELKTRCVHLRTKAGFFPLPQECDEGNPYPTAIWWCAKSFAALGADGAAAHPTACDAPGRGCYQAPGPRATGGGTEPPARP